MTRCKYCLEELHGENPDPREHAPECADIAYKKGEKEERDRIIRLISLLPEKTPLTDVIEAIR